MAAGAGCQGGTKCWDIGLGAEPYGDLKDIQLAGVLERLALVENQTRTTSPVIVGVFG